MRLARDAREAESTRDVGQTRRNRWDWSWSSLVLLPDVARREDLTSV